VQVFDTTTAGIIRANNAFGYVVNNGSSGMVVGLINTGPGTIYLADDGTYKPVQATPDNVTIRLNGANKLEVIKSGLGAVMLSSTTTQVIDSDIALYTGRKLLGTDNNGTEHILIAHEVYQTGQQTEVGSEADALCLN
jgi:hypothetical protein